MGECARKTRRIREKIHTSLLYVNHLLRVGRDDEVLTQRLLLSSHLVHLQHLTHEAMTRKLEFSFRCGTMTSSAVESAFGKADACAMTLTDGNIASICQTCDVPLTDVMPSLGEEVTLLHEFSANADGDEKQARPTGVAIDEDSNIFVVDRDNRRVKVFSETGTLLREMGDGEEGGLESPFDVVLLSGDRVAVSDSSQERINIYSRHGRYIESWCDVGKYPRGLTICRKTKQVRKHTKLFRNRL